MLTNFLILVSFAGLALATPTGVVVPEPRQSSCQYSYTFQKTGQQAYLQSPGYPNQYPNNADCKYTLASPPGTKISMTCDKFNVEHSSGCVYDRMTISLSGDAAFKDALNVCGEGSFTRVSTSNALAVRFVSDGSNPATKSILKFNCILTVTGTEQSAAVVAPTTTKAPTAAPSTGFSNSTCSCGTRNENTRIVGGVQAGVNEFPWRAALYSPKLGVFCGATVISENWILTAAHCTAALNSTDTLYADVGDHDLSTTTEAANQLIKCDKIIQHAQYNDETQDNDVALCHLEKPLTYSRTIQPVCLPWTMKGQTFQGKTVTASGWGTTASGGSSSSVLKKVDLPIKTTDECRKYYQGAITDNMICTYNAGKDTCQGDSGGSIDYRDPNTSRYFGIGVVSWGVGCAGVDQPGVYAKVTNYLDWITKSTTGEQFCR